jgi:predicted phage replisome organizer
MAGKRYYWIKLKTDFFNQEAIDYMMGQKNGCKYIVLYQMLCLQTANSGGELSSKVGEFIIPYNVDKIVRDTKYFDSDTVMVALELFKRLGLIYEQEESSILKITNHSEMVGSETASAARKRNQRARIAQKSQNIDNMLCEKA